MDLKSAYALVSWHEIAAKWLYKSVLAVKAKLETNDRGMEDFFLLDKLMTKQTVSANNNLC